MTEDQNLAVIPDKVSVNVLSEAIAKGVVALSGIVTSSLVYRSTDISWTLADFANYKTLMYWYSLLIPLVIFGLGTAIVKSMAEKSHSREEIGPAMTTALLFVTITFSIVAIVTVFFGDALGFLSSANTAETMQLRALWIILLISILPSAYLYLFRAFFTGIQRNKNGLYADITYNISRVILIVYLFFANYITILNVLIVFLITTIFGFLIGGGVFVHGLKKEKIRLTLQGTQEDMFLLLRIGSVFVALALLASFSSSIVPLLVNQFGTKADMAHYSLADKMIQTIKSFIYAPYAVLLPNIAAMYAKGQKAELTERFRESYRIIVPMLLFIMLSSLILGSLVMGTIYGTRGLDMSEGLSAAQFFAIMVPVLFITPLGTIYSNMMVVMDRMKALLAIGSFSVFIQAVWIFLAMPFIGVLAMAYSWIMTIPVFAIYHHYSRKKLSLSIDGRYLLRLVPVGVVFLLVSWTAVYSASLLVNQLLFIPFINTVTISSFLKLLVGIPLWYAFLGISLLGGLIRIADLNNLKNVIKTFPPLWWISKPILGFIEKVNMRWVAMRTATS